MRLRNFCLWAWFCAVATFEEGAAVLDGFLFCSCLFSSFLVWSLAV